MFTRVYKYVENMYTRICIRECIYIEIKIYIHSRIHEYTLSYKNIYTRVYMYTRVYIYPQVEWRGLRIGGGNLIHRKVVFCIFRCQSI